MATTLQDQKTPMATATAAAADDAPPPPYTEAQSAALSAAVAKAEAGRPLSPSSGSPFLAGGAGPDDRLRKYNMYYTTSRLSTMLHRGKRQDTPAEFYMQSDVLAMPGKPQLLLRRTPSQEPQEQQQQKKKKNSDKDGPVLAWGRMQMFPWRHCVIGLGDPKTTTTKEGADGGSGIKLHRDMAWMHCSDWRFSTAVGSSDGKAVEYIWRKDMAMVGATVYKCVAAGDESTVYARLLSGGAMNGRKGGEIMVREGLAGGLEELMLVGGQTIWAWEALDYQSVLQGY
ncbi:uncharacterized protein PG986_011093 [Apiospora aurea]|uniref:Uncharacterized protein n=1 Tax=Apiospora aurea TaxID=335848 RepID=A0ABR1Q442_9PEZI